MDPVFGVGRGPAGSSRYRHRSSRLTKPLFAVLAAMTLMVQGPAPARAAQTITIAPTQPVILVDNGDTAQVGYRVTFTGDPADALDRDLSLTITTGTALQVGGSPGNAQNVTTQLAGARSAIATAATTIAQGRTFLWASAAAGATNIKVFSVNNFFVGQALNIGNAPGTETVTITDVGTAGQTGSGITFTPPLAAAHGSFNTVSGVTPAGSTTIRVASVDNLAAGQTVNIDSGANAESATVAQVGEGGAALLAAAASAGDSTL
jgi:hypothetical protein